MNFSRRFYLIILVILTILLFSCDLSPDEIAESEQPPPAPIPTPNITIEIVGGTTPELRRVSKRPISQNNCDGTAIVSSSEQISHSIARTIEVGGGLEISGSGAIKIAGTGVDLGATVAGKFGHSYGTSESFSHQITVSAPKGTNMEHHLKVIEVWEVGTAKIVLNSEEHYVPFSFRNTVELGLDRSVDIGCPSTPTEPQVPESVQTLDLQWTTIDSRTIIDPDGKAWEKYEDEAGLPGLYLRTDHINAFGDFLELDTGRTFYLEENGKRRTGTWQVEEDKVILTFFQGG